MKNNFAFDCLYLPMQESCSDAWILAAALACAVTTESTSEGDAIAKKGSESLFSVISKLVPEVRC